MKILIATDGSESSAAVIEKSCKIIGKPENTEVKIITAVEPMMPMGAEPFAISAEYYAQTAEALLEQGKKTIEQAEKDLRDKCSNLGGVSSEVIRGGAAQAIVEKAQDWNADLIVVGSHGYGFWSRALLGSVSNSIANHAPCSVLIVRTKK